MLPECGVAAKEKKKKRGQSAMSATDPSPRDCGFDGGGAATILPPPCRKGSDCTGPAGDPQRIRRAERGAVACALLPPARGGIDH